ncbi:MAG: hypothetical protein HC944_02705, partial [Nanoarchaeota archaeon]|nr:hypothetical protein [Nanoarchaeota archaeon]
MVSFICYRTGTNSNCSLILTNLAGSTVETINTPYSFGTSSIDVSGKWYMGSNSDENGNFFNGVIDDFFHWNSHLLTTQQRNDIARVHYNPLPSSQSHLLNISAHKADPTSGTNLSDIFSVVDTSVPFYDPLGNNFNHDATYGTFNYTAALGEVTISSTERLNYTISYSPATSTWVPLPLNLKIDDDTITPYSSLLQIPPPDIPFPSYWIYDKSDRLEVSIYNVGPQGSWFVYQGTRAVFYNPIWCNFLCWS